ncbi:hemimethylated DNA-binding YccV-like domain-containing protein [Brevundimonas sp.]|uniref:hemimethylated DNA-binding YccV-like domain-containing protein n=1 Tax=Brevundimonas sp. TaxID=1871086 RepID=UPI002FCAEF17
MTCQSVAKFGLGQIVRRHDGSFRGVVIDIDASYAGDPTPTSEAKSDQPWYKILAIGLGGGFVAYAPEDVLEHDPELSALSREAEERWFTVDAHGRHAPLTHAIH